MPFTVVGFNESRAGTTGYTNVAACADQHVTVEDDIIYIPELNRLVGAYMAGSPEADEAYLTSPSLRRVALVDLAPIQKGVNPDGWESVHLHPRNPIRLEEGEGLECLAKETGTTTDIKSCVVFLADGPLPVVTGEIWTVQATATITTAAKQWVNGALTFRQTLPVGRYRLVGCRCKGSTIVAFRFVFVGAYWRPGGIGVNDVGAHDPPEQRYGGMGVWGEFESRTPPTVEIIGGTEAAQSPELYMDLIKL